MGGQKLPPVPDYRIYKVENCPQLMRTKRMLAQHGLKDPWLRNEVWRYPKETLKPDGTISEYGGLKHVYFRKIKLGFALAVLTVIGEKTYHHFYPEEHHH